MKYEFLVLAVIAALVTSPASSSAQDAPAEGATIKGNLVIGRSTFALPPGDWSVVAVNSSYVTSDGSSAGNSEAVSVQLVQTASDGTFVASIWHYVPLGSSRSPGRWEDASCNRKDTLWRDDFSVGVYFPECLLINHFVQFWVSAPTNEANRKTWNWFQKNKVKLPATALVASYTKYFSGDFVKVNVAVNPEYFGQDPSLSTVWKQSEWHPWLIKNDPKRLAFIENFKKWSYVMAENARSTLMDRKPKSASLTALSDLRVVSPKVQSNVASIGADETPISAPYVEPGDCWSYRAENYHYRGPIDAYEICVTFVDKQKNVILAVSTIKNDGRETEESFSSEWAPGASVTGVIFTPQARFFQFPLQVGKTYSCEYEYRAALRGPNAGKATWQITVVGWEDVTVSAGTFRALKIEGRGFFERYDRKLTFNADFIAWYAREANRYVKYQYRDQASRWQSEELLTFKLNK